MIKLEAKKVMDFTGKKGFLVLKASCLPAEKLPKEYLELKEPGDIKITKKQNGILIEKIDDEGKLCWMMIRINLCYEAEGYLERLEDIKKAGNRLTAIKRELERQWTGTHVFKY